MRIPAPTALRIDSRRGKRALWGVTVVAIASGLFATSSREELIGYALITLAALAPTALWLRVGAPGIPVLPAGGALYYLYYALPMLTGNLGAQRDGYYSPDEILSAALTVTLFLAVATFFWWIALQRMAGERAVKAVTMSRQQFHRLIFPGFALGLTYFVALAAGLMGAAGTFSNFLRMIAVSALLVSCYTLGHGRARKILFGTQWVLLLVVLGTIIILAWSTLFLVDGLLFAGVAGAGYVFTCKRIPWRTCLFGLALVGILHAGKGDMRAKYWLEGTNSMSNLSISAIPERMAEWLTTGVGDLIFAKEDKGGQSVIDRASLFWLLLRVQRLTPDYVPYLGGETYAMMPQMIVPRFVKADKLSTQAVITLLNIRYGFQTAESAQTTAIGWGLIAEAYANFGHLGVVGIAMVLGLAAGILMRGSIGQQVVSLPSLIAMTALNTAINLEWDFSYVVLNTGQAIVALTILYMLSSAGLKKSQQLPQFAMPGRPLPPPAALQQVGYSAGNDGQL